MLQKKSIEEYRNILAAQCGVDLSLEEAEMSAGALLRLYIAVFNMSKDNLTCKKHERRKEPYLSNDS